MPQICAAGGTKRRRRIASPGLAFSNALNSEPISSCSLRRLAVTTTRLGYDLGILLIGPLGDIVDRRQVILLMMVAAVAALLLCAAAPLHGTVGPRHGADRCVRRWWQLLTTLAGDLRHDGRLQGQDADDCDVATSTQP